MLSVTVWTRFFEPLTQSTKFFDYTREIYLVLKSSDPKFGS